MKKVFFNILFILTFFLPVSGQEDSPFLTIGYCDGRNGDKGEITSATAENISAAVEIAPQMVRALAGNDLSAIRVYLPAKTNINSLTVWVRNSLDGENVAESTVKSKSLSKGWNELSLETPFKIEDGETFYMGYTFSQKKRAYAICCTGDYREGGLYYRFDGEDWIVDTQYGNLCIEGVVTGDNLPRYDLSFDGVVMEPLYYISEDVIVNLTVTNRGVEDVTGFDLQYEVPDLVSGVEHIDCMIPPRESVEIKAVLPPFDVPSLRDIVLSLSISKIDNGEDVNLGNNSREIVFSSTDKTYRKVVLLEEFTTEMCGNCPIAAPIVAEAIEKFEEKYPHTVAAICHHSGFNTDFMTTPYDEEYLFLYGGSTYAPAMMLDRYHGEGKCPVYQITSVENILKDIEEAYSRHPEIAIEVSGDYDAASGKLYVDVTGMRVFESSGLPLRINVVVTEDNIPQKMQNNAPLDYLHQHVMRTANSTWGDIIEWNGNDFCYSCCLDISEEWVTENLDIVVYVSTYDDGDNTNCRVENTRKIGLPELSSVNKLTGVAGMPRITFSGGVVSVNTPFKIAGVWNMGGGECGVSGLAAGIYIVKVTDGRDVYSYKVAVR